MLIGAHEHWSGDEAKHLSKVPQNPLHAGAEPPHGVMMVVLVVVVVVVVVDDATPLTAGTQSSLTVRGTSTAGPKLVLLIDTA
jgi:hypothetical protein